jgi:hypothetical protein
MQIIHVEMDNVKIFRAPEHFVQHDHVICQRIAAIGIEPQGADAGRNQFRRGDGIAASEQSNLMALPNQLFRQVRNYTLGPSIQARRSALIQRRNLCNSHGTLTLQSVDPCPLAHARGYGEPAICHRKPTIRHGEQAVGHGEPAIRRSEPTIACSEPAGLPSMVAPHVSKGTPLKRDVPNQHQHDQDQ